MQFDFRTLEFDFRTIVAEFNQFKRNLLYGRWKFNICTLEFSFPHAGNLISGRKQSNFRTLESNFRTLMLPNTSIN